MKRFLIFLSAILIALGLFLNKGRVKIFKKTIKELELVESYPKKDTDYFGLFKNNISHWSEGKMHIKEIDGDGQYTQGVSIEDPLIEYGENFLYLANPTEGQIYYLDDKLEMVERIETGREIFNIKEIHNHLTYHVKEKDGEAIGIINNKGQMVMNYEFLNENILTYDLSKNGKILILSKIEIGEEGFKSSIERYENGEFKDNILFQDELIVQIKMLGNNEVIFLTDSSLYSLSDKEILWSKEFNLIKDIGFSSKYIYILYSNYLEILNYKGEVEDKLNFEEDYTGIQIREDLLSTELILTSSNRVTIIKPNKEIITKKMNLDQVDFYKDYYFILDNEQYGKYHIIDKEVVEESLD